MNARWILVMAPLVAMLGGCGGGGGGDAGAPSTPVTAAVPDSASQSVAGLMRYLVALVAAPADNLEPVDLSTVTLPSDDMIEPQPID